MTKFTQLCYQIKPTHIIQLGWKSGGEGFSKKIISLKASTKIFSKFEYDISKETKDLIRKLTECSFILKYWLNSNFKLIEYAKYQK